MSVRIGPAGWSYKDWNGKVYPDPPPPGFEALSYIAEYFDCVELNNTFYRPPSMRMSEGWVRKTGDAFTFTAKLWQKFTHDKQGFTDRDVETYRSGIAPLAEAGMLGALLLQFPWFFKDGPEARSRIEGIVEHCRDVAALIVEVRHLSFGSDEFLEFLRGLGVGFCNIDQPRSSTSLSGTSQVTGKVGYIRLHGRNREAWFRKGAGRDEKYNYLYTAAQLEPWVAVATEMAKRCDTLFIITNNHFEGKAVVNAVMLRRALDRHDAPAPPPLALAYSQTLESS